MKMAQIFSRSNTQCCRISEDAAAAAATVCDGAWPAALAIDKDITHITSAHLRSCEDRFEAAFSLKQATGQCCVYVCAFSVFAHKPFI